jgi:hypothetical protein
MVRQRDIEAMRQLGRRVLAATTCGWLALGVSVIV